MIICVATFFVLQKRSITIYYLKQIVSSGSSTQDIEMKSINHDGSDDAGGSKSDVGDDAVTPTITSDNSEKEWRRANTASLKVDLESYALTQS